MLWRKTIYHRGLKASRVVRGSTSQEVDLRAQLQLDAWDQRWRKAQQSAAKLELRQQAALAGSGKKELALQRTREAEAELAALGNILREGIETDHVLDWDSLKSHAPFSTPRPKAAPSVPAPGSAKSRFRGDSELLGQADSFARGTQNFGGRAEDRICSGRVSEGAATVGGA